MALANLRINGQFVRPFIFLAKIYTVKDHLEF